MTPDRASEAFRRAMPKPIVSFKVTMTRPQFEQLLNSATKAEAANYQNMLEAGIIRLLGRTPT